MEGGWPCGGRDESRLWFGVGVVCTGNAPSRARTNKITACVGVWGLQKCVSVSAPGLEDEEEEDKEEEQAKEKQKIEEDEIAELRKRNWDQPFMTYEPHPSAVGWDKAHWKTADWLSWGFTGPVLSLLFTIFVVATFGWLPGLGVALTCAVADTATYYWNW